MSAAITQHDALVRLGASTAEAVAQTLEMFAPGEVTRGEVSVVDTAQSPFGAVAPGTVAAGVSYVDGVTGANVFLAPPKTVRTLAAKMGVPPEGEDDDELTELELSAMSEASNQMMAAAAAAIGVVLGQEIAISPPSTHAIASAEAADEIFGTAPWAAATTFLVDGEPCRLVQLIPSAFVQRVMNALDELADASAEPAASPALPQPAADASGLGLTDALAGIRLRVWAELGRTRLPLGHALAIPPGSVIELDRSVEDPVELYVNGVRFALGHLVLDDDGRWALAVDELAAPAAVETRSPALAL